MLKDLLIITCVLLIILTLISLIGGSIRFNDDLPKVIHPERYEERAKIEHSAKKPFQTASSIISDFIDKNKTRAQKEKEVLETEKPMKPERFVEGFQGLEFAMF